MGERTQIRLRALALFAAPLAFLLAIIVHPYLVDELDTPAVAAKVVADPGRWVLAHVLLMVGFAAILLAVVALRELLRAAGEERWSFIAVPVLIAGGTVFIGVWGFEITVAAVANVGGDVEAVLEETDRWFGPLGIAGYAMFFLGWLSMALAVRRSHVLNRRQLWVVLAGTFAMFVGLSFPSTAGAYLFSFGMMGFMWTVGYHTLSTLSNVPSQSSGAAVLQRR